MNGTVTFVPGDSEQPPKLAFSKMTGKATVKAFGQTITTDTEQLPFDIPLEPGDFC